MTINQLKSMYLIVVDTTRNIRIPINKISSDRSVDNISIGHQNVSWTGLR